MLGGQLVDDDAGGAGRRPYVLGGGAGGHHVVGGGDLRPDAPSSEDALQRLGLGDCGRELSG